MERRGWNAGELSGGNRRKRIEKVEAEDLTLEVLIDRLRMLKEISQGRRVSSGPLWFLSS